MALKFSDERWMRDDKSKMFASVSCAYRKSSDERFGKVKKKEIVSFVIFVFCVNILSDVNDVNLYLYFFK